MKKNKLKAKLFAIIFSAALLLSFVSLNTLAASKDNCATDTQICVEQAENTDTNETDIQGDDAEVNFFEKLYCSISDYISEILCVLAFGGSFLIAVLYKKGLLPLLKSALSALSTAVGKIKDTTEKSATRQEAESKRITDALSRAYELIEGLSKMIGNVEERLDGLCKDDSEREKMKIILKSEVELLYDIFMSSALPEYQKDSVAKRLKTISSAINEEGEEA